MSVMLRETVGILAGTALSVLMIFCVPPAAAEESRPEPSPSTRLDSGMPERLSRQIAPNPSTPWRPPALQEYTNVLKAGERVPIDPQKRYDLVELIDLAQRTNPETRVAWEGARRAAIGIGLVQSEYFPVLALAALGGYKSVAVPAPKDVAPSGFFRFDLEQAVPMLNLMAPARFRAPGECPGRGQGTPHVGQPGVQSEAPGDRLPRPECVSRPDESSAEDRGCPERPRRRPFRSGSG